MKLTKTSILSIIIAMALALSFLPAASACVPEGLGLIQYGHRIHAVEDSHKVLNGKFVSKVYHEDGDYTTMNILTECGDLYSVDYYIATLYDPCTIELDGYELVSVTTTHAICEDMTWLEELDEAAEEYFISDAPMTAEDGFWSGYMFAYEQTCELFNDGDTDFSWAYGLDDAAENYMRLEAPETTLDGFWLGYEFGVCTVSAHFGK